MRASMLAIILALTACATAPTAAWRRADGGPVEPTQLQVDQTICRGEVQKADLAGNNGEVEFLRAKFKADIMAGCMAQHGYLANP